MINGEICICKRGQINLNGFIKEYTQKGHEDRNAAKSTELLHFTTLCSTVFLPGGILAFFKHSLLDLNEQPSFREEVKSAQGRFLQG